MFTSFAIAFPQIDPVLVSVGPLVVRWYALAYIAGFVLGWRYCVLLAKQNPAGPPSISYDDFMTWAIIGTVLGGRLGYVLFYQFDYYLTEPLEALKIWRGGMSFHGGMLGVIIAACLFVRSRKMLFFAFSDLLACATPIGLFFGRLANFINGELFGRETDVPWAIVFPRGGDIPRHPSQIYESMLEGLVLFIILSVIAQVPKLRARYGFLSGSFLVGYGIFRFFVEFFREPDQQLGFLFAGATMGQLLCVPMAAFGAYFIYRSLRRKPA
ncbi:MAG: prolipoprotein diacylglyceryl transferase [Alphaproteobacteria bacterium]|nr:prolipoprotein diacylglyceryl transferase [Alphaproteobacteria bacterium]